MMTIDESTTVLELLTAHPQTFDVLVNHGMCEDCKADPPPIPLHHFAAKHCSGDVEGVLHQLREAIDASC